MKIKNILLKLLLVIFTILFLFSLFKIVSWIIDNIETNNQIKNIKDNVLLEEDNSLENTQLFCVDKCPDIKFLNVDIDNLKKENDEVVGWIEIPNTKISYPFVQHSNNRYYLYHSFDKSYNDAGWVFLDYRNPVNFTDTNSIIYAHGRVDGTMFGTLKDLFEEEWLQKEENHVVRLSTSKYNFLYQIFSVYHIRTTNDYINTNFENDEAYLEFIDKIKKRSIYDFKYDINEENKILTLSTCYNSREKVVLHAKLVARQKKKK